MREARHRRNFAGGAVRSGEPRPANGPAIPGGMPHGAGPDGTDPLMGAPLGSIERDVSVPMRGQLGEGGAYAPVTGPSGRAAIPATTHDSVKSIIGRKTKAGETGRPREIFENLLGEKTYGARGRKAD